ncbi:putative U2 small nuclear ribonucleoprotein family protein [Cardiosporidium cionae]|uniref:U2 small nuclear ribonucleoprotein family protein n=1 Tax=Cardiosporidium cionae TaxID=476202 RepID=A0ABQ7J4N9_9APIC|nr:putative U2 small nuclear ribonucleoprotein family protein [Cardiosporidium cionae]|eukprot:KAF8818747.1 putative U2 small nuclear ribonucleoprotein family protein [Cardiosporidium cionae]
MENGETSASSEGSSTTTSASLKTSGFIGLTERPSGDFDSELYGSKHDKSQFLMEIPTDQEEARLMEGMASHAALPYPKRSNTRINLTEDLRMDGDNIEEREDASTRRSIAAREDDYRRQRLHRMLSPERADPFSEATPGPESRTYGDVMIEQQLDQEKAEVVRQIRKKQELSRTGESESGGIKGGPPNGVTGASTSSGAFTQASRSKAASEIKRRRWDQSVNDESEELSKKARGEAPPVSSTRSEWDTLPSTEASASHASRWDTPTHPSMDASTPSLWGDTPYMGGGEEGGFEDSHATTPTPKRSNRWDAIPSKSLASSTPMQVSQFGETPTPGHWGETPTLGATPTPKKKLSRWDATPMSVLPEGGATPGFATPQTSGLTPGATPLMDGLTPGATPFGATGFPSIGTPMTPQILPPDQLLSLRIQNEIDERNRPLTDEELDQMLPSEGYEIVKPPTDYQPIRKVSATATPTPLTATPFYKLPEESLGTTAAALGGMGMKSLEGMAASELADVQMKPEDYQYFGKLFESDANEADLSPDEVKERKILALLLKIKNGTPSIRRTALRTITEKAKEFGPGPLFNQILPLMMQSTLEDQERHLLVKVIDRVLYKLDDQVRPYVHKILVVIEPLLIDEDYYARVEGREIISNLAKAAGLATMIATMRPDIDHPDEYVRNTTARAFAVVASALGIPSLILFLKAVCQSKKSWRARHTGIKIIQQISILMGCAVLPHLKQLVDIIAHGLQDDQQKVRTITALALAALAEASAPFGIEAFDCVLRPLWEGIASHRGKGLAAFLKAIGLIIPLMDAHHASYYTREVMVILVEEFATPDEEMKKIVLKVVKQCVSTEGVEAHYIRSDILGPFFQRFWIVRNALDRRNSRALVETTVELANKVGGSEIIGRIVEDLKDPSEPYRKMVMETIESIIQQLGVADMDQRLEELLVDGILYAFQEQASDDTSIMLSGFGTIVNCLGVRVKPYLPQIAGIIRWRLNTPSARVRQQAADLIARIAVVMKQCDEEQMLGHLSLFLFEYLGEEYPEVLGSILGALKAIVNVIGMERMTPPVKDLLPRLTPVLKNRHEKVQENVIDLVGRIADRGGDLVSPKEWDRICFDLLELLKAHKKSIRRAAVNTFGYIARTIGPHDVLSTLLNNLRVQERQLRVCTTIAIAIVSETCLPYSVLPALMNEYRVAELNVQNGVLKTLSFMFEYIGEMGKDYIYCITPMLEDALMDRDLVHRQTAAWACKHLALGVHGLGCEDALQHLLNYVWPNIFETSPHLIQAVFDAIDGFHVALGPATIFFYLLQGLFHPARKVRETYWRIYNNLYIGHQDALVPLYPVTSDDIDHCYRRTELQLLI